MIQNNKISLEKIHEFSNKYLGNWKNLIKNEQNHEDLYRFFTQNNNIKNFLQSPAKQRYKILENYCKKYQHASESFQTEYLLKNLKINVNGFFRNYLEKYLKMLSSNTPEEIARKEVINHYVQEFYRSSATPQKEFEEYLEQLNTLLLKVREYLQNQNIKI